MSRIENLKDYNKVRMDLQAAGGSMETLYKEVGDTAIAEAAPKIMAQGIGIGMGLMGLVMGLLKTIPFIKDRARKIKNEPALKQKFMETLEDEILEKNEEECTDESRRTE